jgi:hypothetical protein
MILFNESLNNAERHNKLLTAAMQSNKQINDKVRTFEQNNLLTRQSTFNNDETIAYKVELIAAMTKLQLIVRDSKIIVGTYLSTDELGKQYYDVAINIIRKMSVVTHELTKKVNHTNDYLSQSIKELSNAQINILLINQRVLQQRAKLFSDNHELASRF